MPDTQLDPGQADALQSAAFSFVSSFPRRTGYRPGSAHSFTQSLRVQLAGASVKVVELAPPGVKTPLFRGEFAEEMKGQKAMDVRVLVSARSPGSERVNSKFFSPKPPPDPQRDMITTPGGWRDCRARAHTAPAAVRHSG